jgi:hypothetical protein
MPKSLLSRFFFRFLHPRQLDRLGCGSFFRFLGPSSHIVRHHLQTRIFCGLRFTRSSLGFLLDTFPLCSQLCCGRLFRFGLRSS